MLTLKLDLLMEALEMLPLKVQFSRNPVVCSFMLDEMAIHQNLEFDGTKYYGGVDLGTGMDTDNWEKTKKYLVSMVVAMKGN